MAPAGLHVNDIITAAHRPEDPITRIGVVSAEMKMEHIMYEMTKKLFLISNGD